MRRPILLLTSLVLLATGLSAASARPVAEERAGVHTVGGCALFPADNPWNQRIGKRPVWKWSSAIVSKQAAGVELHLDLGATEEYYGIPVNVVPADQPLLPLAFGVDGEDYGPTSSARRAGPRPTPPGCRILPGLLDDEEAATGRITHALRFTLPNACSAYTWPAATAVRRATRAATCRRTDCASG